LYVLVNRAKNIAYSESIEKQDPGKGNFPVLPGNDAPFPRFLGRLAPRYFIKSFLFLGQLQSVLLCTCGARFSDNQPLEQSKPSQWIGVCDVWK
jgi:hypothetical protein